MPSSDSKERHKSTQWSDWEWDIDANCYRAHRYNSSDDEYEYHYNKPPNHEISTKQQETSGTLKLSSDNRSRTHESDDMMKIAASNSNISSYNTGKEPREQETLDPSYRVHRENEFKWGRVFKILLSEPTSEQISEKSNTMGGNFQKIRRLVVINSYAGHCVCLPIQTYCGQGVKKSGFHANDHTVIYHTLTDGKLQSRPIELDPSPSFKPNSTSRPNYAKHYTVENNVKVWFVDKTNLDVEKGHHHTHIYPDQCSIHDENHDCQNSLGFRAAGKNRVKSLLALNILSGIATSTNLLWLNARMSLVHQSLAMHTIISTVKRSIIPAAINMYSYRLPLAFIFVTFTCATAIFTGTTFFLALERTKLHNSANPNSNRVGERAATYCIATTILCLLTCALLGFTAEELVLVCLPPCVSIGIIAGSILGL